MNFKLTEEQELLLESLDEFLDGCGFDDAYFKDHFDRTAMTVEFNKAMLDAGFTMLGVPEEYGGSMVDNLTLILVAERMGRRGFPVDFLFSVLQIDDMLTFGNEEQKKIVFDYLNETGNSAFSLGISEPQAGSDDHSMTTSATHKDGKVIINGHKSFISYGKESPYILCLAKEADIEGNPISMYFVPSDAKGVTIQEMHKIGFRGGSLAEIYLEDVEVPESALVGELGNGFMQLMLNFEMERLVIATMCLGAAECAFDDACKYANQRVQFGEPIANFQLIQKKIADMYVKVTNMKHMIYAAACKKDAGESIRVEAAACKYYCANAGFEVVDDAMQILGGIGYTEDHRISRFWRDLRVHRIAGGTDEMMIRTIARPTLKKYR